MKFIVAKSIKELIWAATSPFKHDIKIRLLRLSNFKSDDKFAFFGQQDTSISIMLLSISIPLSLASVGLHVNPNLMMCRGARRDLKFPLSLSLFLRKNNQNLCKKFRKKSKKFAISMKDLLHLKN